MILMGLGNPGPGYAETRHNVGYRTVNKLMEEPPLRFRGRLFSSALTARLKSENEEQDVVLLRYAGFMNNSGIILPGVLRRFRVSVEDLVVVVDNMDLPPGELRLRRGGGHAGHNGLKSIIRSLGSSAFVRLYIGVGRPGPDETVVEHVLGVPGEPDAKAIDRACDRAAAGLKRLRKENFDRVAEELNRRGN